ncbi:SGNH/GDSL hydrolase family protein [Sinomonas flava]|uniref:SGNH/GDSL hydrolase family protein n=1 Tax=Sinomonas flava TaxID=496857 RepID=UPI0039A61988
MSTPVRTAHPLARVLTALFAAVGLIAGVGALPASAAPAPPVNFVNLGDSYSAGWGAGAIEPNPLVDSQCLGSSPDHITALSALTSLHLVGDYACAGATLAGSIPMEIAIAAQRDHALNDQTGLVTLTGGGNDLGFDTLLKDCGDLKKVGGNCTNLFTAGGESASDLIAPLVQSVASQIRAAAPNARIAWLGYPHLFATPGLPTTMNPGGGFLTAEEVTALNGAADALNTAIETGLAEAAESGVANTQFITVVSKFAGHEIGSYDSWMTPLVLSEALPGYIFNLHPNATGYLEGYYPAVVSQVKPSQLAHAAAKG